MKYIAVMGHGVVGSGVCEIFWENREKFGRLLGFPVDLKYVLDLREFAGLPYSGKFTKDFEAIAGDPEVAVVAEVMGGVEPAFTYVRELLSRGKSVVTSNKELVATRGAELLAVARRQGVSFLFEASVGGGIPLIHPMSQCLAANSLHRVEGILNGTTNFILTKMKEERLSFGEALSLAQKLGYAERDPRADIQGQDACRKICILASMLCGRHVYPQYVSCEGIEGIEAQDVAFAQSFGGAIKLVGSARLLPGGRVDVLVAPRLIPGESQLAHVSDVFNAVMVYGSNTGEVLFYGKGAGKLPTGSAVVSDILDCLKTPGAGALHWEDCREDITLPREESVCRWFIRFACGGEEWQAAKAAFPGCRELPGPDRLAGQHALLTEAAPEGETLSALAALERQGIRAASRFRLLEP